MMLYLFEGQFVVSKFTATFVAVVLFLMIVVGVWL